MTRTLIALALALTIAPVTTVGAEDAPPAGMQGRVENRTYISPTGVFKVTIPVLPELGGAITDTPNVVTFEDSFNTHISIAAFPQDAMQRWELSTRGLRDYLEYFFRDFVVADFRQSFEGVKIESSKFGPVTGAKDGALLAYLLIPGGTMFGHKVPRVSRETIPVAKRGNLLFVRNGHIFVVSIELAERVIEGKAYTKTTAEEDEILRGRLNDLMGKIEFAKPPAAPEPTGK